MDEHHIKLPKLGLVYFKAGRILNGKIRAVTVRVNSRKQYQASILVESENQTFKKTKKSVGIDLGLKSLTITSDGQKEDILKVDDGLNKQLRIWERKKSRRYENAKKESSPNLCVNYFFSRALVVQGMPLHPCLCTSTLEGAVKGAPLRTSKRFP